MRAEAVCLLEWQPSETLPRVSQQPSNLGDLALLLLHGLVSFLCIVQNALLLALQSPRISITTQRGADLDRQLAGVLTESLPRLADPPRSCRSLSTHFFY